MYRLLTIAPLCLCLAGCDKKDEGAEGADTESAAEATAPAAEPAPAPAPEPEPEPVVAIHAGTVTIAGGEPSNLTMGEDGEVTASGEKMGSIAPDGTVRDAEGATLASLAADGTLSFEGSERTLVIAEDGTVTQDGTEIAAVGEDGTLGGPAFAGVEEDVTFEVPPEGRRALAAVFFTAMFAASDAGAPAANGAGE